ncbi:hypothetical protein BOTBODRAFT_195567 [Botryobasidium botryosum FD-172 SS1]|uniref:Protein kinase domain-containing protein n=1 Tax=Botryobasidium botryosum (strain FD-172 SS1) TaxID=930990 RepID=A0A067MZN7_BOTB1|nr:hypothetical protein BOTBODRAFT_195567 [Botryobasidium botryosum FD-172 SS1]
MVNLRKIMLARPGSQGQENLITRLAILYAEVKAFPFSPDIQEYEIEIKTSLSVRGGFGDCFKGIFLGQFDVAMKCLRPRESDLDAGRPLEAKIQKLIAREVHVWKKLDHCNILPLIGLCTLDSVKYMVSPWMSNGNAVEYIKNNPSADRLGLLGQAAEGLKYLHEFNPTIIHGDVRGHNILVSETGEAKLADFGLSYEMSLNSDYSYSTEWKVAGNWAWLAPELVEQDVSVPRTTSTDVFSFGRTIVQIITGNPPFYLDDAHVIFRLRNGAKPTRPENNSPAHGLTDEMWELADRCWNMDPEMRPTIHEVAIRIWGIRGFYRSVS